jgi:LPS export ABC transporter protein LptC
LSRKLQILLGLAALLAIIALNAWLQRWLAPEEVQAAAGPAEINYALDNFEARFFNADGEQTVRVAGPRLEHGAYSREAVITSPRFTINPDGEPWEGTAERARIERDSQVLRLESTVRIERDHARGVVRIASEQIDYDHPSRRLHAPLPAQLEQAGNSLSGGTLTVWIDDERMELHDDVQAIYRAIERAGAAGR